MNHLNRRQVGFAAMGAAALSLVGTSASATPGSRHSARRRSRMGEIIDLSHPLERDVATYPGFPTPVVERYIGFEGSKEYIAEGREFAIDQLSFIGGSSTYIDAPRHFSSTGADIAALPLERLVDIPAVVVAAPAGGRREYQPADFDGLGLSGRAVLLATGWDSRWATPAYQTGSPYLGPDAAHLLRDADVAFVGIDAVLVDDIDDPSTRPMREAHFSLLGASIPIVENMAGITSLSSGIHRLTAVPAAVRDVGSFPVRVFARTC